MPPFLPQRFGRRWRGLRLSARLTPPHLPSLAEAEEAALHLLQSATHPRKWWTRGIFWLSLLVGLAMLLSASFQVAMWMVPSYRNDLARVVSKTIGHPVSIGKLALSWHWAQPMLEIKHVTLFSDDARTPLAHAESLRLGFLSRQLLSGQLVPTELNLAGAALAIDIEADGSAHLRGLPVSQKPMSLQQVLHQLRRFARIKADAISIVVRDLRPTASNFALVLQHGDLRIEASGIELRANVRAPGVLADQLSLRAGLAGDLERPESLAGEWSLEATKLAVGSPLAARFPTLARLRLADAVVKAKGDFRALRLGEANLQFSASAAGIEPAGQLAAPAPALLHELEFSLRYAATANGGSAQLRHLKLRGLRGVWPAASAAVAWQGAANPTGREYSGSADFLRLDDLAPWLALAAEALQQGQPGSEPPSDLKALLGSLTGDVQGVEARYSRSVGSAPPSYALHARLLAVGVGARSVGEAGELGVHGLSGDLSATEAGGKFNLAGNALSLVLPKAFKLPAELETLGGNVSWQRETAGWKLQVPDLAFHAQGIQGKGHLSLATQPGQAPTLDLDLRFSAADAARLKPWMPVHWGDGLKNWLDHAIVRARVPAAHLWINGPMADFPFHKNPSGDWGLDLSVAGARLEYSPDWPGADQVNAELKFRGNGLQIDADHGLVSGVTASSARGQIADFADPLLLLDIKTAGEAGLYYALMRDSPLQNILPGLLNNTDGEGPAETDVHLEVPLHADSGRKLLASGVVRLSDNRLRVRALDAPVEGISGTLRFGGAIGVAGEGLSGRFYDTPVTAEIAPVAGIDTLTAHFSTRFNSSDALASRYLPAWLLPKLDGSSVWRLTLPLSGARGGKVQLATNLLGATSQLPVPLNKTAGESLPLHLAIDSDEVTPLRLNIDVESRLGIALRFARERGELSLHGLNLLLGGGAAGTASEEGVRLTGAAERINGPGWLGFLAALHGNGMPFLGAQFSTQHLLVGGFESQALGIIVARSSDGALNVAVSGSGGAGTASVTADGSQLRADFSRLNLQAIPEVAGPKPVASSAPKPAAPPDEEIIDPGKLPALRLRVDNFSIGKTSFGMLSLNTERDAGGQSLNSATLTGGVAQMNASGYWHRSKAGSEAATRFTLNSQDIASVLEGLGFAPTLSGKAAQISADLRWSAAKGGLDWPYARGKLDLSAENGSLTTVDPGGAGRVLGLLNLYALPRRLLFDFHDVLNKGLGYDRIEGGFDLADGVAKVRKLSIKGPSLKMEITGSVGLARRDLDQIVTVTPNTNGLTLGAVLLGGATLAVVPAVGVLAVIANQVLDKPIGQATQFSYRLTGPWDNPQLRRSDGSLVNAPAEAPASAPAPAVPAAIPEQSPATGDGAQPESVLPSLPSPNPAPPPSEEHTP